MKFDYATEKDDGDVELHFSHSSRCDIPAEIWAAIINAAKQGRLA